MTSIKIHVFVIGIFVVIGFGGLYVKNTYFPSPTSDNIVCSADAKQCPDGSSVSRTGLNCEFAECPDVIAMKKEDGETITKYTGIILAGKSAPVLEYNKTDYDVALKSDKLVVLYFYANWCPLCKAEFPKMQEAFSELTTDKVIGFRVSFKDDETSSDEKALAVRFGVPYQHTKVFLRNGKSILKAPDSWDEDRYDMEIGKALGQ